MSYVVWYSEAEANQIKVREWRCFSDPDEAEACADELHEMLVCDHIDFRSVWVENEHGNQFHQLDAPEDHNAHQD